MRPLLHEPRPRGLRSLGLSELVSEVGQAALGGSQLTSLDPAGSRHLDPMAQQRRPRGGERVAFVSDLCRQRLLTGLERSQPHSRGGDTPACPAHGGDDLDVLALDPLGEREPLEQILKPV
jgi:hypothetical protein